MFAVLKSKSNDVSFGRNYCCHLSNDKESADKFVASRHLLSSNGKYDVVEVSSMEELAERICPTPKKVEESDVLAEIIKRIDDLGLTPENIEKFTKKVNDESEKALAEVRSLGIQGMQVVGDGFVALGDLLRKAAKK